MRLLALVMVLLFTALAPVGAVSADLETATLYKDADCGCCGGYAAYLRRHGFRLRVVNSEDMASVKEAHGVPAELVSCHTMVIEGYVVEGHVPVDTLNRLLSEKPNIEGIALPGMPDGVPGMNTFKTEPFVIYEIGGNARRVYGIE